MSEDHDLLVRLSTLMETLIVHNKSDHDELKASVLRVDCSNQLNRLEGRVYGGWVVFGGLLAVAGVVMAYLRGR